ncbi:ABC transporter substrate-binding protein, partial [Deinococcus sp. 6YEL10]|uniref:ABC transporter substrate-binding protein n=1 Tax=Deinococcus sp. 6YEL10 TaxID=2745870 RepID=UPI001E4E36C1
SYWGRKPALRIIIIQKVPELAARYQAFLRGDADLIEGGTREQDEMNLRGKPGVVWVEDLPNVSASALFMNQNIKSAGLLGSGKLDGKGIPATFFRDANVRRAFSYAFDYDQYIQEALQGQGKQRTMLLPDTFPGYDAKISTYTYDAAQARQYFQRAWQGQVWTNGFVMTANYRQGN